MMSHKNSEVDLFLQKPDLELMYIYNINPSSADAALAHLVLEYRKFKAAQAHNDLLARQNKALLVLTVVLAFAAMLQVVVSGMPLLFATPRQVKEVSRAEYSSGPKGQNVNSSQNIESSPKSRKPAEGNLQKEPEGQKLDQ